MRHCSVTLLSFSYGYWFFWVNINTGLGSWNICSSVAFYPNPFVLKWSSEYPGYLSQNLSASWRVHLPVPTVSATNSGEYAKKRSSVLIFVQSIFLYQLEIIWNAVTQFVTSSGQNICYDDDVISYTYVAIYQKRDKDLMTWLKLLNVYGTALWCQEWLPGFWHARPRRMTCSDSVIIEQCVKDHRRKSSVWSTMPSGHWRIHIFPTIIGLLFWPKKKCISFMRRISSSEW